MKRHSFNFKFDSSIIIKDKTSDSFIRRLESITGFDSSSTNNISDICIF